MNVPLNDGNQGHTANAESRLRTCITIRYSAEWWRAFGVRQSSEVPAVPMLVFYDLLKDMRMYTFFEERVSLFVQETVMHL